MKQNNKTSQNDVNIFNFIPKKYGSYIFDTTAKYQKKYGFDMGTGEHATWNNEADAFKHAFMQAQLALIFGKHIAKGLGDFHEYQGNKSMGQSIGEYNMDNWNNQKGREIAKEIINEYGILSTIPTSKINDIIAEKIMQRMKSGQLIKTPNDNRKFNEHLYNTGFENYKNPLTGNNRIFTREEIKQMSTDEYSKFDREIMAQLNSIGIPTNADMKGESLSGRVIYINSYIRSDGTKVRGYYRSK